MKILAIGSPKGGVGKTTIAVNLAHVFATAGLKTIAIDADDNRSMADWLERAGDAIPVDWDAVSRPRTLSRLAEMTGYDLMVIDLPGSARQGGELRALLAGAEGERPVVDLLLMPAECADMDLRVVTRVLPEIMETGVEHLMVFSRVPTQGLAGADRTRTDYRNAGYRIANTMIRRYQVHQDAVAIGRAISDIGGGRHSQARAGEEDMRRLAREAANLLGLDVTIPGLPAVPSYNDQRS